MADRTPQLVYRLSPERRKELKQWALAHDTTIQAMIDKGLELLLNARQVSQEIDPAMQKEKITAGLQSEQNLVHTISVARAIPRWQRWLGLIFSTSRTRSIDWLAGNIAEFLAAMALRQMKQRDRSHSGSSDEFNADTYPPGIDFAEEAEIADQLGPL